MGSSCRNGLGASVVGLLVVVLVVVLLVVLGVVVVVVVLVVVLLVLVLALLSTLVCWSVLQGIYYTFQIRWDNNFRHGTHLLFAISFSIRLLEKCGEACGKWQLSALVRGRSGRRFFIYNMIFLYVYNVYKINWNVVY